MRSVRDIPLLENIPVLLRASLNVPVEAGKVIDAFRIEEALATISYLRTLHARVVVMGQITGKGTETLLPMYEVLKEKIPGLVWCPVTVGKEARQAVRELPPGGVVLLENLRRNKGEEANDPEFTKELAMLADVFVQDAFDVCHREHASVVGVPTLLPSYAGLLVEKEVAELTKALTPKRPSLAVIAGAKFSTKEPVLKKLLATYDQVFVGGALANDFIKAKGYGVGTSLVSNEGQQEIQELLMSPKLLLPTDALVARHGEGRDQAHAVSLGDIPEDAMILDVGPQTAAVLTDYATRAKTVLWNGPLGRYEDGFVDATQMLAQATAASSASTIIGGGDTVAAIQELGLEKHYSFISTGGGAMLDFLAYGTLPGLEALR